LSSKVSFGHDYEAWNGHAKTLRELIEQNNVHKVCEVGGGANPLLPVEYLRSHSLEYTILDISQEELDKAPAEYHKVLADICASDIRQLGQFDLVFTKMLAEHVRDGRAFHRNIHTMLSPGGLAFHFFPTLFAPPFLLNWLFPEWITRRLLQLFAPRDQRKHGKFPAHYSWCRGPSARQLARLTELGFEIIEYRGFFGHGYYKRIPGLREASAAIARRLVVHPIASLTTFAYVIARKPGASTT
jgi:hypothetical protein